MEQDRMQALRDFLGVGEEHDAQVLALHASAVETIRRATGIDWEAQTQNASYQEAVRVQVWLSYYAVRDASKNAAFLQEYLAGLLASLQLCQSEVQADAV